MLFSFLRYGAKPVDYWRFQFWRKSASECDKYFTSMRYSNAYKKIKKSDLATISKSKVEELKMYSKFVKRDWMEIDENTSDDIIIDYIRTHKVSIIKPIDSEQGMGVIKVDEVLDPQFTNFLNHRRNSRYLMEECLENIDEFSRMTPSSLNTVRATTLIDRSGKVHIVSIMLRVGAKDAHVDNWGAGGICYNFDVNSGICNMPGLDKSGGKHLVHPSSNVKMIGYQLPNYSTLLQYIYDLASYNKDAWYIGWDIAVTPNGYDLIEVNFPPGHEGFQAFGIPIYPLFKRCVR